MAAHDGWFIGLLVILVLVSAFFSSSETAMMRLNRYRIRHLSTTGHHGAQRIVRLLARTDRLLGLILIGNTLANVMASSVATVLAVRWYGQGSVALAAVALTVIILIFAEVMPKTMAALYPEKMAFPLSLVLKPLLTVMYPLVWLINGISNGLLFCLRVPTQAAAQTPISSDELRTIVRDAMGDQATDRQRMLLRVLDLEQMTVDDLMIPRRAIDGIDLEWEWSAIESCIRHSHHLWLPVYRGSFDHVVGVLRLNIAYQHLLEETLTKDNLMNIVDEAYFIPERTTLSAQLLKFRSHHQQIGVVVDEYGDVLGLLTLEDLLEEIVGEFALNAQSIDDYVDKQAEGCYLVAGTANVRELNRTFGWQLPQTGPKTISGVVIDGLETIPHGPVCLRLNGHAVEVVSVQRRRVLQVKLWPRDKD